MKRVFYALLLTGLFFACGTDEEFNDIEERVDEIEATTGGEEEEEEDVPGGNGIGG